MKLDDLRRRLRGEPSFAGGRRRFIEFTPNELGTGEGRAVVKDSLERILASLGWFGPEVLNLPDPSVRDGEWGFKAIEDGVATFHRAKSFASPDEPIVKFYVYGPNDGKD